MNPYEILGVSHEASRAEIKRAYLKLAKIYHPDKGGDAEMFNDIKKAFDVLYNEQYRREYDETGSVSAKRDIDSMAISALSMLTMAIVEQNINNPNVDIVQSLKIAVSSNVDKHASAIKESERTIQDYKKVIGRILKKNDGENILCTAIKNNISNIESMMKITAENIKVGNRMIEMLDDYEYTNQYRSAFGSYRYLTSGATA